MLTPSEEYVCAKVDYKRNYGKVTAEGHAASSMILIKPKM